MKLYRSFNICVIFVICLYCVFAGSVYPQNDEPDKRNIDIFDGIVYESLNELENQLVLAGRDKVYDLVINDRTEEGDFLQRKVKQRFNGFDILTGRKHDSAFAEIVIDNIVLKTNYPKVSTSKVLGDKMADRVISVAYDVKLIRKVDSKVLYLDNFSRKVEDEFELDNMDVVEQSNYSFTDGPEPEEGFLSKYLLPTVVLVASAVTIVLFFVIRSE